MVRQNHPCRAQHKGIIDDIDELPDVAGPGVAQEYLQGLLADAGEGGNLIPGGPGGMALKTIPKFIEALPLIGFREVIN
jgi:hypothetical protein